MDDLLASYSILLISESQRHDLQGLEVIHVIQGECRVGARVDAASDCKGDVAESEGCAAGLFFGVGLEVFSRS